MNRITKCGLEIRPNCWKYGDNLNGFRNAGIDIGDSLVATGAKIDNFRGSKVIIGDDCVLTEDSHILAHDASSKVEGEGICKGTTTLGNNVFLGYRAIVLMGVTIGDNVIIGAGSIVTKDVPSNEVWAGNPARKIRDIK